MIKCVIWHYHYTDRNITNSTLYKKKKVDTQPNILIVDMPKNNTSVSSLFYEPPHVITFLANETVSFIEYQCDRLSDWSALRLVRSVYNLVKT